MTTTVSTNSKWRADFWSYAATDRNIEKLVEKIRQMREVFVVCKQGEGMIIIGDCDKSAAQARIIADALNDAERKS